MGCCFLRFEVCVEGWAETQGSLGKEIPLHGLFLSEGSALGFVGSSVIGLQDSLEVESFLGLQEREGWARIGKRAKCSGQVTTVSAGSACACAGSACFAKISSSSKLTASACEWPVVFGCIEELPFAPDLRLLCG